MQEFTCGPLPPPSEFDEFQVVEIDSEKGAVTLRKSWPSETVYLPISSVMGFFQADPNKPAVLQLVGRLQWLTLSQSWGYFPEKKDSDWGVATRSADNDPEVKEMAAQFRLKGHNIGWANETSVSAAHWSRA
jgi:hypothetical protein